MDIQDFTSDAGFQLVGMTDSNGDDYKVFYLDVGEIFVKAATGDIFKLAVDKVTAEDVDFIAEDDWS